MFLSLDINSAWVSHGSFLYVLPEHGDLLNMDFSQSSVATYLERSGLFKYDFITNFWILSLRVNEFWKSVKIWRSYGQENSV